MEDVGTVEELFVREYPRLVRALGAAFDPEAAADAVQDAFIEADRRWRTVSGYVDPAGWIRRVALNRLLTGRRNATRRAEILATVRPVEPDDLTDAQLDLRRAVADLPERMRLAHGPVQRTASRPRRPSAGTAPPSSCVGRPR